ncbi:hypothetical protein EVAR_60099_1 [Eumeta japonica]|uniref:Uncharacterized protein n=1 Tax=Eumeta variegata TaxID=151549 RepID=A0A4C2A8T8_EUMVA|nr:hypothetical protein EVAR_60099_1 [Eumeta japonica]
MLQDKLIGASDLHRTGRSARGFFARAHNFCAFRQKRARAAFAQPVAAVRRRYSRRQKWASGAPPAAEEIDFFTQRCRRLRERLKPRNGSARKRLEVNKCDCVNQ